MRITTWQAEAWLPISPRGSRPKPREGGSERGQYDQPMSVRDVIVVGAGPSGLATAIALKQLGLDYLVIEKGTLVESIRRFPVNMVFFTTPELMEVGGIPLTTPYDKPTRLEALLYYRKVTDIVRPPGVVARRGPAHRAGR